MKNKIKITISIILFSIFICLMILVKNKTILNIDLKVYDFVANFINDTNTTIFKFFTFFGGPVFIGAVALLCLFKVKKSREALEVLSILIMSTILNSIIKLIIARPRPDVLRLVTENSYSFPSGHTMAITSLVGVLLIIIWKGKLNKKQKYLATVPLCLIVPLVMISRIYLGVHYFSDVLAGFILSLVILLLFSFFKTTPSPKKE